MLSLVELPAGTVTFLFTDIEASTALWEQHPQPMRTAVYEHDELLDRLVRAHGGVVFKRTGDGAAAAFADATAALRAAVAAQATLRDKTWPDIGELRVRIGLHTGPAEPVAGDYLGPALNRCARVMATAHGGQVVCSGSTAGVADLAAGDIVLRDLGAHQLRGVGAPIEIHQVSSAEDGTAFPPLRVDPTAAAGIGLPSPRTTFVGREAELALLDDALQPGAVVTLTGMGGTGKTRLAVHAARHVADRFPDGVHMVELADVEDRPRLASRLMQAAGGVAAVGDPIAVAVDLLARGDHLLVIDNCEHVVDDVAALAAELADRCPRLTILATSREPLGIDGERVVRVPTLEPVAAAALFVDRATAVADKTPLPPDLVAQLCDRLDGIPLAIELAASRLSHLTLTQVVDRLNDRFRLLAGGRRGIPRQQTLRAALDWSHDLLSVAERAVLRRLAVFVGGWTLDAAEAVTAGDPVAPAEVVDLLGRLVDRSLVAFDEQAGRYSLLETVRDYAEQTLVAEGESVATRNRHLQWAVAVATAAEEPDGDPIGGFAAPVLVTEFANLTAAARWAWDEGDLRRAARIVVRLMWAFSGAALYREADSWLPRVADAADATIDPRDSVLAGIASAGLANIRGDFAEAERRCDTLRERIANDSAGALDDLVPIVLRIRANALAALRGPAVAEEALREAAAAAAARNNPMEERRALGEVGAFRMIAGDQDGALSVLERAVTLADPKRDTGEPIDVQMALITAQLFAGRVDDAAALMATIYAGDIPPHMAWWYGGDVLVRGALGDMDGAHRALLDQIEFVRNLGQPFWQTTLCVSLGAAEVLGGDVRLGARLLGSARRGYAQDGIWRAAIVGALYVLATARARAVLGDEVAKAERAAGMEITPIEALETALGEAAVSLA